MHRRMCLGDEPKSGAILWNYFLPRPLWGATLGAQSHLYEFADAVRLRHKHWSEARGGADWRKSDGVKALVLRQISATWAFFQATQGLVLRSELVDISVTGQKNKKPIGGQACRQHDRVDVAVLGSRSLRVDARGDARRIRCHHRVTRSPAATSSERPGLGAYGQTVLAGPLPHALNGANTDRQAEFTKGKPVGRRLA